MESKQNIKCLKHPQEKVQYFQVKNIENNKQGQNLFYCIECIDEDDSFNKKNYILISKFIEANDLLKINPEWPPNNDSTFLKNFINAAIEEQDITSYEKQIVSFFDVFRMELLEKLNIQQKIMLQMARELFKSKSELIQKYQDLTKIQELKQLLTDHLVDIQSKENQYKKLHQEMGEKYNSIIQELSQFANVNINNNNNNSNNININNINNANKFDLSKANNAKEQILSKINELNFFILNPIHNNQNNNNIIPIIPNQPNIISNHIINSFYQLDLNSNLNAFEMRENKYNDAVKNQNNSIQIIHNNQNQVLHLASDAVLNKSNSYVFHVQIQQLSKNSSLIIGFVDDKNKKKQYYSLVCGFIGQSNPQKLCLYPLYKDMFTQSKGKDGLMLSEEKIIEVRVCLQDETFIFLDYPLYQSCLKFTSQKYQFQFKDDDIRLYLGFTGQDTRVKLIGCKIVDRFE